MKTRPVKNICYKVVQEWVSGRLTSCCASNLFPEPLRLRYEEGKWTKPKVGRIFVFADLNEARKFRRRLEIGMLNRLAIYKATYRGKLKKQLPVKVWCLKPNMTQAEWLRLVSDDEYTLKDQHVAESRTVPSLKLLERV